MFGNNRLRYLINQNQLAIAELKKEIDIIKNVDWRLEVERLKTQIISLRGLVNRKIGGEAKTESINNSVLLPENGSA